MVPRLGEVDLHTLPQADVAVGPRLPLERAQVRVAAGEGVGFVDVFTPILETMRVAAFSMFTSATGP